MLAILISVKKLLKNERTKRFAFFMMFLYISDKIMKMKKLFFLLLSLFMLSCAKEISKKDLEGSWYYVNSDLKELLFEKIIFEEDSVKLIDFYGYTFSGDYTINKNLINLTLNDSTTFKLDITYKDSSFQFQNSKYQKKDYLTDYLASYKLININSKIQFKAKDLIDYMSTFHILKKRDRLIYFKDNEAVKLEEAVQKESTHFDKGGWNVYLNENITSLKSLKQFFIEMNKNNALKINFITKIDIKRKLYHVFTCYADVWNDEWYLSESIEKNKIPPLIEQYKNKFTYIKKNKSISIEIKSKQDFKKLNSIKINSHYLISIDLDLPIEDYLHLTQELQSFRENGKTKIRTELINL